MHGHVCPVVLELAGLESAVTRPVDQYPRLLAACIGVWPTDTFRAVLWRVGGPEGMPTYQELARCRHAHRNRRKALECAEQLARADGALQDVEP